MPLPDDGGAVPVVLEYPRERGAVARQDRRVAGEAAGELADGAEADRVVVAPGQQRSAGRRAQGGDVEAVVAKPALRHPGVVWASGSVRRTCSDSRTRRRRSGRAARWGRLRAGTGGRSGSSRAAIRRASFGPSPRRPAGGSGDGFDRRRSCSSSYLARRRVSVQRLPGQPMVPSTQPPSGTVPNLSPPDNYPSDPVGPERRGHLFSVALPAAVANRRNRRDF